MCKEIFMVEDSGFEPLTQPCKGRVFPISTNPPPASHATLVGALRFEQRRSKTNDLQSSPDTVTGLNTLKLG